MPGTVKTIGNTMVNEIGLILALTVSSLVGKTIIKHGSTDMKGALKE